MPDKRQTSKQRRAARNRAYREAMTARRENATAEPRPSAESSSSSSSSGGRAATRTTVAAGGRGSGVAGALFGRAPGVGDTAVMLALVFAVAAAVVSLVIALSSSSVPVDHSGDAISNYPAVSREAYAVLHGTQPVDQTTTLVDAYGRVIPIFALLPALVAVGAFVAHRRQPRSRTLTFGLVAMALVSVFNLFSMYFLPALISLAVAGFQVRKAEGPPPPRGARRRAAAEREDDVIEVDEVEPDEPEPDDEVEDLDEEVEPDDLDEDESPDGGLDEQAEAETGAEAGAGAGEREGSDDVLAELEAEIEDEGDRPADAEADAGSAPRGRRGRSGR